MTTSVYSRACLSRESKVRFLRKRVEQAQQALRVASGRSVKGERAQARKDLAMAVAKLAAAMPAGKAAA